MPTITLSVPEELKEEMDKSKFINWSAVAREAIRIKVSQLKILDSIAAKSKLTKKDAIEIGRKIKKSMHKRYRKEHSEVYWMDLIIDANVFISAIISFEGKTRDLLFKDDINLFAPEFLLKEFEKYREYIIKKSKLLEEDFNLALDLISSRIRFIPFSEFKRFITETKKICPDVDDVEYFALALKLGFPIWSEDKQLKKQNIVKIYSTTELLEKLNL